KIWPKWSRSGNTSACRGRNAPPEWTRYTHGSRFSSAISCARRCFFTVTGWYVAPVTVASLHTTKTCRPLTRPIPAATPAAGHAVPAAREAGVGDDARRRPRAVVHAVPGERRDLQERAALVEQPVDTVAREQLAARHVPVARRRRAPERDRRGALTQLVGERP